ncbi:hypothetical protein ACR80S_07695 [Halomonas sp. MA07-2]
MAFIGVVAVSVLGVADRAGVTVDPTENHRHDGGKWVFSHEITAAFGIIF